MTCKGIRACPARPCLHRQLVRDYREERERQETEVENQTEREPSEYDVITFKDWLIAHRNGGRHRPAPRGRKRKAS